MSGVKVTCEVRAYLEREEKSKPFTLEVESHWNYRDRVHVQIGGFRAIKLYHLEGIIRTQQELLKMGLAEVIDEWK